MYAVEVKKQTSKKRKQMPYTSSQAFAGRGSVIEFGNGASSPYTFQQLAEAKSIKFSGTKYDLVDVTNMESGFVREWLPTLLDSGELAVEANMIPGDATQQAVLAIFNSGQTAPTPWQVVLPNGLGTFAFNAYVTKYERDIPLDKEATVSISLKITGLINFWN
jgi:predicted secreted protein